MYSILFTLEGFFPSHKAGTEVYVYNLCEYFMKKGYKISILIPTTKDVNDYVYESIKVYTFPIPKNPIVEELNGIIPPRGLNKFIDKVKDIKPNIVHFHSFGRAINSYHLSAVNKLGIKTAFTPHLGSNFCIKGDMLYDNKYNCDGKVDKKRCMKCLYVSKGYPSTVANTLSLGVYLGSNSPLKKIMPPSLFQAKHRYDELQKVKKNANLVFSIAPWIQNAFKNNNINNAQLIPQGISPLFSNKKSKNKNTEKINFAFIGRMHSSKGFHLLNKAWTELKAFDHTLHVITNPSGGERKYYEENKRWAYNNSNVIWNEALTQHEVAEYLKKVNVLILPSISNEVAPLVILEAAALKIPSIGSDYIAIKDQIINGKNGWLFDNGSWKDLKQKIENLIKNPDQIESVAKSLDVPPTMNIVAEIIEKQFKELLNRDEKDSITNNC